MTQGRRRARAFSAVGSAAVAAAAMLAVQGCAPAAPASADIRARHSVSLSQARDAWNHYLTASDRAAASGDQPDGLAVVADAQWAQVKAQYTALATAGIPVPRYRYGTPVFYVPALTGSPQWFVVAVPRTSAGAHTSPAVSTLMVFERRKPDQPWTLNGSAVLSQKLPPIALDDGYAVPVPTTGSGLLVRPDVVGATQAAMVDDGPASPAAALVAAGPQTTGLYAAQAARASAARAGGLEYQWLLQGAPFGQFGLRLAGGGALVLYGMYLNTTTEHPHLVPGAPIAVPAGFRPLLEAPTEIGYHAVFADWTYQYAAIDPPAGARNAKIKIIASQGAATKGHAY